MRVLLIGNPDPMHVGAHLLSAARELEIEVSFVDVRQASSPSRLVNSLFWRLADRSSPRRDAFERHVLSEADRFRADTVLGVGLLPLRAKALTELEQRGVRTVAYLTDDPWNPAFTSKWLLEALPRWGSAFTTRRENLGDLTRVGCAGARHLPFGYAPNVHFAVPGGKFEFDVLFVGGADADRIPYFEALAACGLEVGLFGGYWQKVASLRRMAHGFAGPEKVRTLVSQSRTVLGLVRRANRDGSAMRSFEMPAMGACLTAEDTEEHQDLFGPEGDAVLYFESPAEACEKTRALCRDDSLRSRLAKAVRERIEKGHHTYADRLRVMLGLQPRPCDG